MHPVLSIGFYIIMQAIVFALAKWCFMHVRKEKREKPGVRLLTAAADVLYVVFSAFPVFGAMLRDCGLKFFLQRVGNIWLGFTAYFNGLMLLLCIACGIINLVCGKRRSHLRFLPPAILAVSLLSGLGLLVYGTYHAQQTVIKEYDLNIEKAPPGVDSLKVVLIADLHMSVNSHLSTIRKMVDKINDLQADTVLIAGDIFTSSYRGLRRPEEYAAVLRGIKTKYGTYAVYGNHDVEETLFGGFPISPISRAFRTLEMEQFFKDCGFTILYDEMTAIADGGVQIIGRVDGEKAGDGTAERLSPAEVLADVDREKPVIVLQHEPNEFRELKENGADLVLCGHTHAGQFFPGNLIVPFFNENPYGYRKIGGLDTIVTAGIGYYGPPMRVGTNSEITVLHITLQK